MWVPKACRRVGGWTLIKVANAHRVKTPMEPYPRIRAINDACLALPAFAAARPDRQPDAE